MEAEFLHNPKGFSGGTHAATIEEHGNDLYIAWYAYPEDEHKEGRIVYSKFDREKKIWPKGLFTFDDSHLSEGNPVLFSHDGKLNLFFVKLTGYWNTCQIYHSVFNEDEQKWSLPQKVNTPVGIMLRHRPVINSMGEIVFPSYDEKNMQTVLYSYKDNPLEWSKYCAIDGRYIQGDIIKFNQKEWQMYLRAQGDDSFVFKTVTATGGKHWLDVQKTPLPCPLSGVAAIKLDTGEIIVCNNHTEKHQRSPISISLTDNKGLSFDHGPWHIDSANMEFSYPSLIQTKDKKIHLVFTYNRKMIKYISLSIDELKDKLRSV